MSAFRKLGFGVVLAAGAFIAAAAAAKPIAPVNPGALVTPHRFCVPHLFTDTFRSGMTRWIVTYRIDRSCRTTIVRIARVPIYKAAR